MHFLTLVAVDVESHSSHDVVDLLVNECIKSKIEELSNKNENSLVDQVTTQCRLSKLRSLTNSFSRAVSEAVEERLEPYCECTGNLEYLEFVDTTEDMKRSYETKTADCVKLPDGKIVSLYEMGGKFVVKNGLLYQKEFGPLKHEKRSKKAKRMKFLPDYPFKKRYKTFQDYAENYCGDCFHEEENAYGYYYNPDSFWDWYRIGGRWPCSFLVKSDCLEYAVGDYDWDYELPVPPEGYAWASAARKKDIQWQAMIDYKKKSLQEHYEFHRKAFETQILPKKTWLKLREDGVYTYDNFPVYFAGETFEVCMKRRNYLTDTDYLMSPCYYVDEDYWHSSDGISFGAERNMDEMWRKELVRFYHSLSDETVLVSVDSHD